MGTCCGRETVHRDEEKPAHVVEANHQKFDSFKTRSLSKNLIIICLDVSGTSESSRLKISLRGTFTDLVAFNGERRLLDQIESTKGHKYLVVIIGKVRDHILKDLVKSPKVVAIYLCLGVPRSDTISQSPKIKGFFEHAADLKKAIHEDISGR